MSVVRRGSVLRMAAFAALALALVGCVPLPPAQVTPPSEQPVDTTTPTVEPSSEHDVPALTTVTTDDLLPGQCISGMPVEVRPGQQITLVPCADRHHAEIVAIRESEDEEYPGDDAMASELNGWCQAMLPAIADGVPEHSVYTAAGPTEDRWDEGDRRQLCFAVAVDAYYTGSFVGGDAEVHTE